MISQVSSPACNIPSKKTTNTLGCSVAAWAFRVPQTLFTISVRLEMVAKPQLFFLLISDVKLTFPSFLSSALIQKMARHQAAVPWIRRRVLGWCFTLLFPRASGESPSCTVRTQTTTHLPKPCPATPPSTVRGKGKTIPGCICTHIR